MGSVRLSYYLFMLAVCAISQLPAPAQRVDTSFIKSFERPNVTEIYTGISGTRFNFHRARDRRDDYRLAANNSGYLGAYVNYKWLSLQYAFNIPGTQLARNIKLQYTSFRFRFGGRRMTFIPFYSSYNGLLIPAEHAGSFAAFRGIKFNQAGLDYFYYTNTRRFSFRAAHSFSEQQVKPAGALFFMATPMWQKISWPTPTTGLVSDPATYDLLASGPEWISVLVRAGYAYSFSFRQGAWMFSPAVVAGAGPLREINTGNHRYKIATDMQAWLTGGYNGPDYYAYLRASWQELRTNLFLKNMDKVNMAVSLTVGHRLHHLRKKILGVL